MVMQWNPPSTDTSDPAAITIGHWSNPDWTEGEPGIFGFVVGVSDYPNMTSRLQSFGFDEGLFVSALTAWEFFRWLTEDGGFVWPGAMPAKVWLLLAPTTEEQAAAPDLATGHSPADLATLERGLGEWYRAMQAVPEGDERADCGVFFFSGHGVSYGLESQLLLPADWPDPVHPNAPNRAPRTDQIHQAVAALPVNHAAYFIDACWENGKNKVGRFTYTGQAPLPLPDSPGMNNPRQLKPILHAANSGMITWQPRDPRDGLSFYGQALLDALRMPHGTPTDPSGCVDGYCPVRFADLVPDVKRRMFEILRDQGHDLTPSVMDAGGGVSYARATWHPAPDREPVRGGGPSGPPGRPEEEQRLSEHHESSWRPDDDPDELHRLTGHESITWPTAGLRFFDLADGSPVEGDYVVHHVRHDPDFNEVRFDLAVPDAAPYRRTWMMLTDRGSTDPAWGCRLPLDASITYQLLHTTSDHGGLNTIDVRLSTANHGALGEIAERWITTLDGGVDRGFGDEMARDLLSAVEGKFGGDDALVAAEIAAAMLYRTDFASVPTSWLQNLTRLGSPDGAVLLARRRLDERPDLPVDEVNEILEPIRQYGLPVLQITTGLLHSLTDRCRALGRDLSITPWVDGTRALLQGSGLFAIYIGWVGEVGPWLAHPDSWTIEGRDQLLADYGFGVPVFDGAGPADEAAAVPVPDFLMHVGPEPLAVYQAMNVLADSNGFVDRTLTADLAATSGVALSDLDAAVNDLQTRFLIDAEPAPGSGGYRVRLPIPTSWVGDTGRA